MISISDNAFFLFTVTESIKFDHHPRHHLRCVGWLNAAKVGVPKSMYGRVITIIIICIIIIIIIIALEEAPLLQNYTHSFTFR